jgi:hypothetical protein
MEYTVTAVQAGDELWQVDVDVTAHGDQDVILAGRTHVCVQTQDEAIAYAEQVFLPDLRRNDKRLADLILSWEQPEEPVEGGDPE